MARTDIHQHLWSPELLDALARRDRAPRVRRGAGAWTLELAGEPPSNVPGDDVAARATLVHDDFLATDRLMPGLLYDLSRREYWIVRTIKDVPAAQLRA